MKDESAALLQLYVSSAFRRFDTALVTALPRSAPKLRELLSRAPSRPEHVFDVRAFPIAALPFWFSPSERRSADAEFQTDLIYSSISGYYAIRLCDNIADNDCPPALRKLAPCTLHFDNEAIRPYMRHFATGHTFWVLLDEHLGRQADASAADGLLDEVDHEAFVSVSSKKFSGAKIPLAAVYCRYALSTEMFRLWLDIVDVLGDFAQFNNDFFDWRHDSMHGITTYLSSRAWRSLPGERVETWFLREGFEWGAEELKLRFRNVTMLASEIQSDCLSDWLELRGRILDIDIAAVRSVVGMTRKFINITSKL